MASPNVTPALPRAPQLDLEQIIREVNAVALECRVNLPVSYAEMEESQ
jgi:hypothetical protein